VRASKNPVKEELTAFALVVNRVCILLLVALLIFVPLLTARGAQRNNSTGKRRSIGEIFLVVCSGVTIAVTCVLPITMCVREAEGSQTTKECWAETLLLLANYAFDIKYSDSIYSLSNAYDTKYSRLLAYFVFPLSILLLSLRAQLIRRCQCWLKCHFPPCQSKGDGRRLLLLFLAGLGQVGFYGVDVFGYGPVELWQIGGGVSGIGAGILWSGGVVLCAGFVILMFWLDRAVVIEHSVPYAMAYVWALSTSVLGASYILGLFHRFDASISRTFSTGPEGRAVDFSTLATPAALTLFSSLVLWVCSQVTGRVTTEHNYNVWGFPALFALVRREQSRPKR
jgi:hypothetical protein